MFYLKEKETGEGNVHLGSQQSARDEHTTPVYNIKSWDEDEAKRTIRFYEADQIYQQVV